MLKNLKILMILIFLLVLPIGYSTTYINKDTGKELWIQDKVFRLFAVTSAECSTLDGTTYITNAGECRKKLNCKPSSDLSVCGCDVTTCDSSSPPPSTTDPSVTTCSKSSGSVYINGQKIGTDGCYSGFNTRFECKPSPSISGYSLSYSGTYYDVLVDGACVTNPEITSGSVTYTSIPTSVIKGNQFIVQANIKIDSIASSDCLQTIGGCRLLFELDPEVCPSGSCTTTQAIIPIFAEKSACDENTHYASTTTIIKAGDIVQATFNPLAFVTVGQYKYRVNVFRGCGDKQLPINAPQININIIDGSSLLPEIKRYCLSPDKKTCTSRLGSCLSDEISYTDGMTCEANVGETPTTECVNGIIAGTGTLTNPLKCCGGYELTGIIGSRKCVKETLPQKQISLTQDEYEIISSKGIAASACDFGSQCQARNGYLVRCTTTEQTISKNKKVFNEKSNICSFNKEDISITGIFKVVGFVFGAGYFCKSSEPPEGTCFATPTKVTDITTDIRTCNPETFGNCPKKPAINSDKLSSLTLKDKLSSQCEISSECQNNNCISLQKLEDDGFVTKKEADDISAEFKGTLTGATVGAGAGLLACYLGGLIITGGSIGLTAPSGGVSLTALPTGLATILGCTGAGAGVGATVGYWSSKGIKAIQSGNKEGYGFCIKEESTIGGFTKFIDSIGKGVNDFFGGKSKTNITNTNMGYIVLGIFIFIIFIAMTRR